MVGAKHLLVAIEGGDGSGKGTHTKLLHQYIEQQGWKVFSLSFPRYGEDSSIYSGRYLDGAYGESREVHPDLASLTYAIDRYAASPLLREKLLVGDVLTDRYVPSNLAHQGAKIAEFDKRQRFYDEMQHLEYDILGIPRPDLSIVLLMPTNLAQANVDKKAARSYTDKKRDIHEADANHLELAKANYEELCRLYPDKFVGVSCVKDNGEMRAIDDIQEEVRARWREAHE